MLATIAPNLEDAKRRMRVLLSDPECRRSRGTSRESQFSFSPAAGGSTRSGASDAGRCIARLETRPRPSCTIFTSSAVAACAAELTRCSTLPTNRSGSAASTTASPSSPASWARSALDEAADMDCSSTGLSGEAEASPPAPADAPAAPEAPTGWVISEGSAASLPLVASVEAASSSGASGPLEVPGAPAADVAAGSPSTSSSSASASAGSEAPAAALRASRAGPTKVRAKANSSATQLRRNPSAVEAASLPSARSTSASEEASQSRSSDRRRRRPPVRINCSRQAA
mmetsp:Transcript_267/g.809  ORF Transcript_267/g.809 Transcript_267/m.809 type:complete len:286 (+) Transcript_267:4892-5749(+)